MTVFAIGALAFAGFTGWLLFGMVREDRPVTLRDWLRDLALAAGVICVFVTAIKAMMS